MEWPLPERLAVLGLLAQMGRDPGSVGTNLPARAEERPDGFIRVSRGPGDDDGITDRPLLDVEAFHAQRLTAAQLAEDARQAMLALSGRTIQDRLVDSVRTASGPAWVFYSDHLHRYAASYRWHQRQHP